ncbi:MAG: hypothetical protein ABI851_11585 [Saprospiraceae bacterium]
MKKEKKILVDIEIDKLTNSIENVLSGDIFDTDIIPLFNKDKKQINQTDWQFNWQEQLKIADREVYKLVIKNNTKIIQGLISLTDKGDHIYMNLIESVIRASQKFIQEFQEISLLLPANFHLRKVMTVILRLMLKQLC